jgi:hypothetical protein
MEDFVLLNDLFDIYGVLLTEKQQEIIGLYYVENLSMQEIAETNGVSKAFIGKVVKEASSKLKQYENSFHLLDYKHKLRDLESETSLEIIKKEIKQIVDSI